jgi:hypothetical protein
MEIGEFWMCSCRQLNPHSEENCSKCSVEKESIFKSLDKDYLSNKHEEFIEQKRIQEEQLKQRLEEQKAAWQQKQAEIERVRNAQIAYERKLAFQKRMEAIEAEEKKKFTIKTIVIVIVIAITIVLIVTGIKTTTYNDELRNIATDSMESAFTNVYADIVSFEVKYTVEESEYRNNVQIGSTHTESVICKCKTVEGKTFWLEVPSDVYTGTIEYRGKNATDGFDDQYFVEPIRVNGRMTTFGHAVDNAPESLKDTLILSISYGGIE